MVGSLPGAAGSLSARDLVVVNGEGGDDGGMGRGWRWKKEEYYIYDDDDERRAINRFDIYNNYYDD